MPAYTRQQYYGLIALLSTLGLSNDLFAEASNEEAFPLPEILITAKRIDSPPSLLLRQIDTEDIIAWNAQTAADAVINAPGINVLYGGSSGDAKIWIRGFRDRDTLVLLNGIPIMQSYEGNFDLNEVALENIDKINILKSAPSVIYGTNGVGGVVDVVPGKPGGEREILARAELGSDGRKLARATASGGTENIGFSISGQHQKADDYSLSDDYDATLNQPTGERVNSDFERNNLMLRLSAQHTIVGNSALFVNVSDMERGLPVEAGVEDPDFERLTKAKRYTLGLSNQLPNLPVYLKLYYNHFDNELTVFTDASYNTVDEVEDSEEDRYGGTLYTSLALDESNILILSGSYQQDEFTAEGVLETGNEAELTTSTLAAEYQYALGSELSLAVGLIYVHFDPEPTGGTTQESNPQAALSWQATPRLRLHASAAQRTRFPKMRELYRRRWGNPNLQPQTANNYELGLQYDFANGIEGDVSLFHSDLEDLIERPDRSSDYMNLDGVTYEGVETALSGSFGGNAYARLSYTYLEADEELPDGGSRQLRSRPKHTAQAELRYEFSRGIQTSLNGIYIDGLHDLDPEGVYTELSSYFVANARLAVPFAEHYEVYVNVSNLTDTDYQHRIGFPREGRSFVAGVALEF
jgi:iron complex outermembrane receptor protein